MPPGIYLIGMTGNIACGKSTVLAMLAELGARVIDADRVTHELQVPGQAVYDRIVQEFGEGILTAPGGPIDRRRLGAIAFSDPAALHRLEQVVHPAVHAHILAWLDALGREPGRRGDATPDPRPLVAVIDAVKLLEAGWKPLCNAIWVVTCPPEQQLERLVRTRGMSEAEARGRIDAQPPQATRVAQADVVIDNRGTFDETRRQVETAWQAITIS
jgi:dephospho-CoA kinase